MGSTVLPSGFKKYLVNTLWQLFEKFFALLVSFFVGIWVARYLGKEQYGVLGYSQSIVGLFACIADFGINEILNKELVKKHYTASALLGTAFIIKLIGGVISVITIISLGYFLNLDSETLLLLFTLGLAYMFHTVFVLQFYFKSKVLGKQLFWASFFGNICSAGLKVYFITGQYPLIYFGLALLSEVVIIALFYIYFYKGLEGKFSVWTFNKNVAKLFLVQGWPLILSTIMVTIFMRVDQVMIKHILGNASNGLYNAAVKLSEVWYMLPVVICNSIFPSMVASKNLDITIYNKRMQSLFSLMFWGALIIVTFNFIFADFIFSNTYGKEYLFSSKIYQVHMFSCVFMFFIIPSSRYLQVEENTKQIFYRSIVGAFSNIIFNIIFIPKYGVMGAAYATLISYGIIAYYPPDLFSSKFRRLFFMKIKAINPLYALRFLTKKAA